MTAQDGLVFSEFVFGGFVLRPEQQSLTNEGRLLPVGARGIAILTALVMQAGEVVDRDSLVAAAWPQTTVASGNLAVQIAGLRKLLDDGSETSHIATVAGQGYRFAMPVQRLTVPGGPMAQLRYRPNNLPAAGNRLIGRDVEIVQLQTLVTTNRLVTVIGSGGIGKTRLALACSFTLPSDADPDGAWFVELAALRLPNTVASAVALALGMDEAGARTTERLVGYLRDRQAVLVLDNCEHVIDEVAGLAAALLRKCPSLHLLATSREALGVEGEHLFPLAPLALPAANAALAGGSGAIDLFVERARQACGQFELNSDNAATVARICSNLDGLPLAIELAAAQLQTISLGELEPLTTAQPPQLHSNRRDQAARHNTLEATLDWSYRLLTRAEQLAWCRLACFSGTWTRAVAREVIADAALPADLVGEILGSLARKSLITIHRRFGVVRFGLLETTRSYLAAQSEREHEKLRLSALASALNRLFEPSRKQWETMPDVEWLSLYEPELDNLRTALVWAFGSDGDIVLGMSLVARCDMFLANLGLPVERRRWLDVAIDHLTPDTPPSVAGNLFRGRAVFLLQRENLAARDAALQAAACFETAGDPLGQSLSLRTAAEASLILGDSAAADRYHAMAGQNLATGSDSKTLVPCPESKSLVHWLISRALHLARHGERQKANACFRQAAQMADDLGYRRGGPSARLNLADREFQDGNFAEAEQLTRAVIDSCRLLVREQDLLPTAYLNLATYLIAQDAFEEARPWACRSLQLGLQAGTPIIAWFSLEQLAIIAIAGGDPDLGAKIAGYAEKNIALSDYSREPTEQLLHAKLSHLLAASHSAERLDELKQESAEWRDVAPVVQHFAAPGSLDSL
jgi:predicted ATPase/DNA-binding winged helix-turn-helix (wHTH) protein